MSCVYNGQMGNPRERDSSVLCRVKTRPVYWYVFVLSSEPASDTAGAVDAPGEVLLPRARHELPSRRTRHPSVPVCVRLCM